MNQSIINHHLNQSNEIFFGNHFCRINRIESNESRDFTRFTATYCTTYVLRVLKIPINK